MNSDLLKANQHMQRRRERIQAYRRRTKPVLLLRLGLRNGWLL
jgi:transcriptional regulator with AAA-type ATPase domain